MSLNEDDYERLITDKARDITPYGKHLGDYKYSDMISIMLNFYSGGLYFYADKFNDISIYKNDDVVFQLDVGGGCSGLFEQLWLFFVGELRVIKIDSILEQYE